MDFEEVGLPAFAGEALSVRTELQNEIFQAPGNPQKADWDKLAKKVVEHSYVEKQLESCRIGFRTVLTLDLSLVLTVEDVQERLAGSKEISVKDWREHTQYKNCGQNHRAVQSFWHELFACSQEQLQAFCQYATGMQCPPCGGFATMRPMFTLSVSESVRSIQAHTCLNEVDLPPHIEKGAMLRLINSLLEH